MTDTLTAAVREVEKGLNDGELGRGLIKKRVARAGEGKRGGYRTIIVYRARFRSVFVYGFPKSAKANLKRRRTGCLPEIGTNLFGLQ